jgi:acyl-[acyl-carrier-protein] desaturase
MSVDRQDVLNEVERVVSTKLVLLSPVKSAWQPSDFLPDLSRESWFDDVTEFRRAAQGLSDEMLVSLVGSMITEEALPSYQTSLNRLDGLKDKTGASDNPWARWTRGWTAEENRHGDLLNRYLYLIGRVDMRAVEVTIHHLIRNGFDPQHQSDPYNGLIYTSFQERATRMSHSKFSQLARAAGESSLGKICNIIAGDEARHEDAYTCFMRRIFEVDPSGAVLAMFTMFTRTIKMPAHLMSDPDGDDVFAWFSRVAQGLGIYTFSDYVDIMEHLIETWKVGHLTGLTGDAAQAQASICRMPAYYRRRLESIEAKQAAQPKLAYPWIKKR